MVFTFKQNLFDTLQKGITYNYGNYFEKYNRRNRAEKN